MYFPFRCTECSRISHAESIDSNPSECCPQGTFQRLTITCLLVPSSPGDKVLLQSKESELVDHQTKWKTACGRDNLPPFYTTEPGCCTCKDCKDYADQLLKEVGWESFLDEEDLQEVFDEVEFEDEPPDPFTKTPS